MSRSFPRTILLLVVSATAISSCGEKEMPNDPQPGAVMWRKPKTGSTYIYDVTLIDSTGRAFAGHVQIDTVRAHDTTVHGIGGLVLIYQVRDPYYDHGGQLFDYRSNGDIAISWNDPGGRQIPYRVYPIGSRTPVVRAPWSILDAAGNVTIAMAGSTITYLGTEQLSVGTTTLATHKVLEVTRDTTTEGIPFTIYDTTWFAPAIGTYARRSFPRISELPLLPANHAMTWELSSYSVR